MLVNRRETRMESGKDRRGARSPGRAGGGREDDRRRSKTASEPRKMGQAEAESRQGEGDGSWMRATKKDRAEKAGSRVEEKDPSQKKTRRQGDGAKPQRREVGAEAGELEVRRTR